MGTVTYHYRGMGERPSPAMIGRRAGYRLVPVYSAEGEHGPEVPYMTRAECRADAKARGLRALFEASGPLPHGHA